MTGIKVAHTIGSLDPRHGGPARAIPELCDSLTEKGVDATVISVQSKRSSDAVLFPAAAPVREVPALWIGRHAVYSANFRGSIRYALQRGQHRIVHDHGLWGLSNVLAAREAAASRLPLVISPHGMLHPWALGFRKTRKSFALRAYQHRILTQAAMFFATAEKELEAIRRAGFKQPVAVVPLGVTIHAHRPSSRESIQGLRRALFLSRIHPAKGLLTLIEAWRQVQARGWKLVIAGPDEAGHRKEVEAAIARAGLGGDVEFVGELEGAAKTAAFESADLFVLPTRSENFGVVVLEAMAHGLPVLTTTGAPWKEIEELDTGWWVEPNVEGIAQGLRAALSTSFEDRKAMGLRGRRLVEDRYAWPAVADRAIEAYKWVCGNRGSLPAHIVIS